VLACAVFAGGSPTKEIGPPSLANIDPPGDSNENVTAQQGEGKARD
jgi:hypothetical protein